MTASEITGEPDLIYINNIVVPRIKITSIVNEIIFYCLQARGGGTRRPGTTARGNVFWQPFWPTRANCHASADKAGCALSTDA